MQSLHHHLNEAPDTLRRFGWDERWHALLQDAAGDPARVTRRDRGTITTEGVHGALGVHVGREIDVAVGDWVLLSHAPDAPRLVRVLPRRSSFVRRHAGTATRAQVLAANIDVALVVTTEADLNPRRLERYAALVWESGATPLVLIGKADACADRSAAVSTATYAVPGADVLLVSAHTREGLDELGKRLTPGSTAVLLGSSGVGKSTLANALVGDARLRTGDVRADGRGRHTTTHRELLLLDGGALLIDTPGMRELALWASGDGVEAAFPEIEALATSCRFRDCAHTSEPGCAVLRAAAEGSLDAERLESWRRLKDEVAFVERRRNARAAAEDRASDRAAQRALRAQLRRKYR